jgi:phosphopantetheinyl transferase
MKRNYKHEIVVRFVRTDSPGADARIASAHDVLSPGERETVSRFRSPRTQADFIAAHALVRATVGELSDCEPHELVFQAGRHGRLRVTRPWRARAIQFSVSYADGVALCAVTRECAIGADVESQRHLGRDPMGIAAAVCSEREHASLRSLPRSLRAERVLAVWTLKEAVAQAAGQNLQLSLSAINIDDVPLLGAAPGAFGVSVQAGDHSRWRLTSLRLAPHYVAAVAVPERFRDRVAVRFEEGHVGASPVHAWQTA